MIVLLLLGCLIMLIVITVRVFTPNTTKPRRLLEMQKESIAALEKAGPTALSSKSIDSKMLLEGEEELGTICDQIMARVTNNDIPNAFAIVGEHSIVPASELAAQAEMTIKQLTLVRPRFGKMLSYELVRRETAGQSAVRYTYVAKCEKHMLRWVFWFYKPQDKWLLDQLRWDDQIDGLFH